MSTRRHKRNARAIRWRLSTGLLLLTIACAAAQAPSGAYRLFAGERFTVEYPGEWEVFSSRDAMTTAIAPRTGVVPDPSGRLHVGYGVLFSYYSTQERLTLEQATRELIVHLQSVDASMRVVGSARRINVGSSPGLVTRLRANSPLGGTELDDVVTVSRPEGLFYMVFIAPEKSRPEIQTAIGRMLESLRFS